MSSDPPFSEGVHPDDPGYNTDPMLDMYPGDFDDSEGYYVGCPHCENIIPVVDISLDGENVCNHCHNVIADDEWVTF